MAGTAQTASTLVNSEPGPSTTWSALAIAWSAWRGAAGWSGSSQTRLIGRWSVGDVHLADQLGWAVNAFYLGA